MKFLGLQKGSKRRQCNINAVLGQAKFRGCQLRFKSGQVYRDLRLKTGHPLEVLGFEGLDVNKLVFVPES